MSKSIRNPGLPLLWIAVSALLVGLLGLPPRLEALQPPQAAAADTIRGTVTDAQTGQPVAGVVVQAIGARASALTDSAGHYMLTAPTSGTLAFSHIAYRGTTVDIAGRTRVDVALQVAATELQQLVVTGYVTQRRGDITGAVSSVSIQDANRQTSSSILQKLNGQVPGVKVESGGAPGTRSTVRVRGIGSFQNNDPLYIVDGTPVEATYFNFIDPNDIESVQVLKDASAASIYGSRATNGVVIVETKKGGGGAPKVTVNAKFGVATPVKGYDGILIQDPLAYFQVAKASYVNAGEPVPAALTALYGDPNNPSIPQYIYAGGDAVTGTDQWGRIQVDESKYSYPGTLIMPASQGTNWWDAVFGPAPTRDVNVGISGGTSDARYYASFGYFDQNGTAVGSRYSRGTVRLNTDFGAGRLRVGENLNLSLELSRGGLADDGLGEGGFVGKNIFQQPIIPLRDIAGNWASGKANLLGNDSNPLKIAENNRHNLNTNTRAFGNAFASYDLMSDLTVRSSLGFNLAQGANRNYTPAFPENSEATATDAFSEGHNYSIEYTENTTLNYQHTLSGVHNVTVLLGQAASKNTGRNENGSIGILVSNALPGRYIQDALADPSTKNVTSGGFTSTLLSYFGKLNYNYNDKYYVAFTLRRDGSSNFGPENRWGTFPAFSVGWRMSKESFLQNSDFLTNLMLRFGYGVTGNASIPTGVTVDQYGGNTGSTFYNVNGDGSTLATGYRQTRIGNPDLKWEQDKEGNIGLDAEFAGGKASLTVDAYRRDTDDLLFAPIVPATQGQAAPPFINVGAMRNTGFEFTLGYRGTLGSNASWNASFNGSHYKNEIRRIAGGVDYFFGPVTTREAPTGVTINQLGHPIGSFYGFVSEGIFQNQQEIDALNAQAPGGVYEQGAKPGRLRFKDVNGDGVINDDDKTIIGSPHPDFTAGLNLGVNYKRWDLGATVFGNFGNDIYNSQMRFDVFRNFELNVRKDLLANSWTCAQPEANGSCPNGAVNPDAKYPRIDHTDNVSNGPSSFYIEDGSYVRLRSVELGYALPNQLIRGFENVRVYLLAENLFTITGYSELDPALPAINATGGGGIDIRDQARGIDRGVYPSNRVFSVGFNVSF